MQISETAHGREWTLKHYSEYTPSRIQSAGTVGSSENWNKHRYINSPITFDCEVTSYYNAEGKKRACMYVWTMTVFDDGYVYFGRTWEDFRTFLLMIKEAYFLNENLRAIIYVHNLPYDSHFFLPWLNVTDLFALDSHTPLSAEVDHCFEFKCSLALSSMKLETIGKDIEFDKLSYNYALRRHWKTELTENEWRYCMRDVIILNIYLLQQIKENHNKITAIAKTKTGIERRACRQICKPDKDHNKMYHKCKVKDIELMNDLQTAFQGGYTHANRLHCNAVLDFVYSYDISSDYPSQIVKQKFPVTAFRRMHKIDGVPNPGKYASLMKITFKGLRANTYHSIISTSKIIHWAAPASAVVDNGRLVEYEGLVTLWITEMDYINICMFYNCDWYFIHDLFRAEKGYLSSAFVCHVLELYYNKTTMKGNPDPYIKILYALSKVMINSTYGMCVTRVLRESWVYEIMEDCVKWEAQQIDPQVLLDKYNKSKSNFLVFQWGVWITAYARHDLLRTIREICDRAETFDEDGRPVDVVVYCDTDSIKLLNAGKYHDIFEQFDRENNEMMERAMKHHGLDPETYRPKNGDGEECPLGVFDYEANPIDKTLPSYRYFKTLGAKRYVYSYVDDWAHVEKKEKNGKIIETPAFGITIAGLPKKTSSYLVEYAQELGVTPFEVFSSQMYIPRDKSGKKCLVYVDNGYVEDMTDYRGVTATVTEKAFIHMEDIPFELGVSNDYIYLLSFAKRQLKEFGLK